MNVRAGIALVTGANRGLGLETSRQLLESGMTVVMAGRDHAALERARDAFGEGARARAVSVSMDVTDSASIAAAHRIVSQQVGPVDVLVNNAAVLMFDKDDVLSIPSSGYRATFETNVFGVIDVCRTFVPEMARRGYGRVVNV